MMRTSRAAGLVPLLLFGAVAACSSDEQSSDGAAGAAASGAAGAPATGGSAGAAPVGGSGMAGGTPNDGGTAGAPAGTAGSPAGGSGGAAIVGLPASDSKEDLLAFIKAGKHRMAPWIPESAEPREPKSSPHGRVQLWMNPPLVDSWRNGRNGQDANPRADPGSMAVKELADAAGQVEGYAVIYRSGAANQNSDWIFYCFGPTGRCDNNSTPASEAEPIYGRGNADNKCHFCHSLIQGLQPYITPPP